MSGFTIVTNHVPRDVIEGGYGMSPDERADFDYIDWDAVERGEATASFVRYKGELIDLNDMERGFGGAPMPDALQGWDNYRSDSFFSGVVVRYVDDFESVIVGRYYS